MDKAFPLFEETLKEYRDVAKSTNKLLPELQETNKQFQEVAKSTNKLIPEVQQTNQEIQKLAKSADKTVPEVNKTLDEIQLTARNWGKVGERLDVSAVKQVATREEVLGVQRAAATLTVDTRVSAYALRIVRATRTWPGIRVGAGPRGGIALVRAARASALMAGRDFVTPDDVKGVTLPALRHRITLAPDLEIEGRDADDVLAGVLEGVEAPRQ